MAERVVCHAGRVGLRDIADASPHRWAEEGSYASCYIKLGRVSLAENPINGTDRCQLDIDSANVQHLASHNADRSAL